MISEKKKNSRGFHIFAYSKFGSISHPKIKGHTKKEINLNFI